MANLTTKITLTSTDASTDSLSVVLTKALTTTTPSEGLSRVSVATSGQHNVLTTADNTAITYVYLKNCDGANIITVKTDAGAAFMDLGPYEWAFMPIKGTIGLEATANTAPCVLEYGYWTKA